MLSLWLFCTLCTWINHLHSAFFRSAVSVALYGDDLGVSSTFTTCEHVACELTGIDSIIQTNEYIYIQVSSVGILHASMTALTWLHMDRAWTLHKTFLSQKMRVQTEQRTVLFLSVLFRNWFYTSYSRIPNYATIMHSFKPSDQYCLYTCGKKWKTASTTFKALLFWQASIGLPRVNVGDMATTNSCNSQYQWNCRKDNIYLTQQLLWSPDLPRKWQFSQEVLCLPFILSQLLWHSTTQ